ncbi:MAG: PH domain-containing protein [Candidatus Aenigmatarchaeota archaeon]
MTVDAPLHILRPARVAFMDVYLLAAVPAILMAALAYFGLPINFWSFPAAGGLALVLIYTVEITRIRSIYKITPNQVVVENGIFKKTRKAVFFNNIVDVNFKQGYVQRLLNYGTITVGSSGGRTHEECELIFKHVKRPKQYVTEIERAMKEFGKHVKQFS